MAMLLPEAMLMSEVCAAAEGHVGARGPAEARSVDVRALCFHQRPGGCLCSVQPSKEYEKRDEEGFCDNLYSQSNHPLKM